MSIHLSGTNLITAQLHNNRQTKACRTQLVTHLILSLLLLIVCDLQDAQAGRPSSDLDIPIPLPYSEDAEGSSLDDSDSSDHDVRGWHPPSHWDVPIPTPYGDEDGPDEPDDNSHDIDQLLLDGETRSGLAGKEIIKVENKPTTTTIAPISSDGKGHSWRCGRADLNRFTNPNATGYIVNGEQQIYGEWPSFVRLNFKTAVGTSLCGGALISDRHVLTAGHCVANGFYSGLAHLGDNNVNKRDEYEQVVAIEKKACLAAKFLDVGEGPVYDYAVLKLVKPVEFTDYVQPACMPRGRSIRVNSHSKCYIVGTGVTKYERIISGSYDDSAFRQENPDYVQQMRVKKVSCKGRWKVEDDDKSRACWTKFNGTGDSCRGDSGGPILCLGYDRRWYVTGVVSYGTSHCDGFGSAGWVGVYTRLPAILNSVKEDCGV